MPDDLPSRALRRTFARIITALCVTLALLAHLPSAATASGGSVRAIVMLRLPPAISASDPAQQQAAVAQAQKRFFANAAARHGAREIARADALPLMVVEIDRAALPTLASDPAVAAVEEDRLAAPALSDSTRLIGATEAWAQGETGAGQTVVVLDTGVDLEHPFLRGALVDGACFSTHAVGSKPSSSLCPNGKTEQYGLAAGAACPANIYGCNHGTLVAGIAVGRDSAEQLSGVAPGADLVSVQVYSRFSGASCSSFGHPANCALSWTSDQLRALDWVYGVLRRTRPVAAVNLSLGSGLYASPCDGEYPATQQAIARLREAGIAVVVAAGNNGSPAYLSAPACLSGAIAVGATDIADTVSPHSNSSQALALLAPGVSIRTSLPGGIYGVSSGTSMAAPHVAGAFAVLRAARPAATGDEIFGALTATGVPVTDPRNGLVRPRIQIDEALARLTTDGSQAPVDPPDEQAPVGSPLAFSTQSLEFGYQEVGTTSAPLQLRLANHAAVAQEIGGIALAGDFARAGGSCPETPGTIPARASCTVEIVFTPTSAGRRTGALTITGATLATPSSVALAGTGFLPLPARVYVPLAAR